MKKTLAILCALAFAGQSWALEYVKYTENPIFHDPYDTPHFWVPGIDDSNHPNYNSGTNDDYLEYIVTKGGDDPEVSVSCYYSTLLSGELEIKSTVVLDGTSYKVTSIPDVIGSSGGFGWCSNLTSIIVPGSVKTIGKNAFKNSSQLASITLNEGVLSIGEFAFQGCALTSFTTPSTITSIGDRCFSSGNQSLQSVEIKGNNPTFGEGIFSSLQNLTTAKIGAGVKTIGKEMFYYCTKLNDVTIGDDVRTIKASAFSACSSLAVLEVPDEVETIETYAFNGVGSIIYYGDAGSEDETWGAGCRNAYVKDNFAYGDKEYTILLNYLGSDAEVTIPTGVKKISDGAFQNKTNLTSVVIPTGVTSIGKEAFQACSNLKSITIPESVKEIGNYAFDQCSSLEEVSIPSTMERIGISAFRNCENLTKSKFASVESLMTINYIEGKEANPFYVTRVLYIGDDKVTNLEIPNTISSIGSNFFMDCTEFTSVSIPGSVQNIASRAFQGCTGLSSVTIAEGVEGIYFSAFEGCTALESVSIPSTLKSINEDAFKNCTNLTEVNFASVESLFSLEFGNAYSNPLCNGGSLLIGGSELTNLTIPSSVTEIPDNMFAGFSSLTTLNIPSNVTSIGASAFKECANLSTLTIAEGLEIIGANAFDQCTSLASVSFPNSVTTLGTKAFNKCTGLTTVVLSPSVAEIGQQAFVGCTNLRKLVVPETVTKIGLRAFYDLTNLTIYTEYDEDDLPIGWHSDWNFQNKSTVEYGCKYLILSQQNTELGSITIDDYDAEGYNGKMWYTNGATATINATPNTGCHVRWNDNTSDKEHTVAMTEHRTVSATFEECTPVDGQAEEATCMAAGHTADSHCSFCGHVFVEAETIPVKQHLFLNYEYNNDATYEADGTETAYCEYGCETTDTRTAEGTRLHDNPTELGNVDATDVTIYVRGLNIVVENADADVQVSDIAGHTIIRQNAGQQNVITVSHQGTYIVKVGKIVKKVIVK